MTRDSPERWLVDTQVADVATLGIPASANRIRRFGIDVRFVVRSPASVASTWHELNIELVGRREWSRRIVTYNPGQTGSLDFHCRRDLAVGRALRVRALTKAWRTTRRRLVIEAEEVSN